jgi:hypothetical protein
MRLSEILSPRDPTPTRSLDQEDDEAECQEDEVEEDSERRVEEEKKNKTKTDEGR